MKNPRERIMEYGGAEWTYIGEEPSCAEAGIEGPEVIVGLAARSATGREGFRPVIEACPARKARTWRPRRIRARQSMG